VAAAKHQSCINKTTDRHRQNVSLASTKYQHIMEKYWLERGGNRFCRLKFLLHIEHNCYILTLTAQDGKKRPKPAQIKGF
jgi:hypothetical protein